MSYAQEAFRIDVPADAVPVPLDASAHERPIARRRVGRPPVEESIELVIPSQFHTQATEAWCPGEKQLVLAVLTDAIDVLVAGPAVSNPRRRQLYDETAAWFGSNDTEWPYSFVNICDVLGLDVRSVRNALVRRCEEARQRSAG
jgi:hypothetical protein